MSLPSGAGWSISTGGLTKGETNRLQVHNRWNPELEQVILDRGLNSLRLEDWESGFGFLQRLPMIKYMMLRGSFSMETVAIEDLQFIESLDVQVPLTAEIPLHKLSALRRLRLSATTNLTFLKSTSIVELSIPGSLIARFTDLQNMLALSFLSTSKLTSDEGLELLSGLRNFCFGESKIVSIEKLGKLSSLEMLRLTTMPKLKSVAPIAQTPCLKKLDLNFCSGLQHIRNFRSLAQLRALFLDHNKPIPTLEWVRNCRELRSIYLEGTRILDGNLDALLELPKLQFVGFKKYANYTQSSDSIRDYIVARGGRVTRDLREVDYS